MLRAAILGCFVLALATSQSAVGQPKEKYDSPSKEDPRLSTIMRALDCPIVYLQAKNSKVTETDLLADFEALMEIAQSEQWMRFVRYESPMRLANASEEGTVLGTAWLRIRSVRRFDGKAVTFADVAEE